MLGGSAKMGIKNVSSDGNPSSDGLQLIREYEVTFSSSGTTDGGLMFGAGISFDEGASGTDTSDAGTADTNAMPGGTTTNTVTGYAVSQNVWVLGGAYTTAVTTIDPDNLGEHELNTDADDDPVPITAALVEVYNAVEANENDYQEIMITWKGNDLDTNNATSDEVTDATNLDTDGDQEAAAITVTGVTRERATVEVTDTDTDTDTNTHKVRNGIGSASVYVGAADGSWKLKFGTGLDAGIYKIGDIGVAGEGDSFYATNGHSVELSGSFEGADFAITSNAADGNDANSLIFSADLLINRINSGIPPFLFKQS